MSARALPPAWRRPWRRGAAPVALLAALNAVLYHRVLFGSRIFYERDVHTYYYPFFAIFREMVRSGEWPLWNPYVGFGQPLLANPQLETFYPLTWLVATLSLPIYYVVYVLFHSLLTAAGAYRLCRALSISRAAALTGAAVWTTCGPWLSLVPNWLHLGSAAWFPWLLLAAERFVRAPGPGRAAWWGLAAALQLLAGSPDLSLMGAVAGALRIVFGVFESKGPARRRIVAFTPLAALIAAGLASAQWIPTLALAASSSHPLLSQSTQTFWSVHPLHLLQAVTPVPLREMALGPIAEERLFESREPFLFSLYLGLPAAALVAGALASVATPWRWYAPAAIVLAVLWALGRYTPAYQVLAAVLPVLQALRFPMKAMALAAVPWSVLAAAGLDAWARGGRAAKVTGWTAAGGALGCVVLLVLCRSRPRAFEGWVRGDDSAALSQALAPAVAALAGAAALSGLVAALTMARGRGVRLPYVPLLAACAIADLLAFHATLNDTAPRDLLSVTPPALRLLPGRQWSRVYSVDYSIESRLPEVTSSAPHLLAAEGAGAPPPKWLIAAAFRAYPFHTLLGSFGLFGSFDTDWRNLYPTPMAQLMSGMRAAEGTPARTRLLQVAAVERVIALHPAGFEGLSLMARLPGPFRGPVHVFAVPDAVSRTYVVARVRHEDGPRALAAVLASDFRPQEEAVLSFDGRPPPPTAAHTVPAGAGRAWSRIALWRPDFVRVEAETPREGWVVLVDAYDPDWKATVDGAPAQIVRANVAFRAVAVPAGRHAVDFAYRPRAVAWGLSLSSLTLIALVASAALFAGPARPGRTVEGVVAAGLPSPTPMRGL